MARNGIRTGGSGYNQGRRWTMVNGRKTFTNRGSGRSSGSRSSGSGSGRAYSANQESSLKRAEQGAGKQMGLADRMSALAGEIGNPEQAAGEASADVLTSFENAENANRRNLARYGVDPSSGRYQAQESTMARARARAEAGAKTQARRGARMEGLSATGAALSGMGQAINSELGIFSGWGDLAAGQGILDHMGGGVTSSFRLGGSSRLRGAQSRRRARHRDPLREQFNNFQDRQKAKRLAEGGISGAWNNLWGMGF
jgi:hypothetical protein